eukprot:14031751-Ditylum_brightwellii.AAC.1
MHWLHMHTVQRIGMPKGIPTKIACGTVRSIAGVPPCNFVGEGRGSDTKAVGLHMTYTILLPW